MPITNLSDIEKTLRLDAGTLQKAIEAEENVSIEIPELVIKTKEENEQFLSNIDLEKKERYDAGKEKGVKDDINANLSEFGLDLDGQAKTFTNFANALKEKITNDLGKPKDEVNQSLKEDNEKLRANYEDLEKQFNIFKSESENKEKSHKLNSATLDKLPNSGTIINKDEIKVLFDMQFRPGFNEDNKIVFHNENGDVMKNDTTRNPLTYDEVMPDFLKRFTKPENGNGMGDDDETGAPHADSYEKFEKEMIEKGHKPGSQAFQLEMNSRTKEGTLKI